MFRELMYGTMWLNSTQQAALYSDWLDNDEKMLSKLFFKVLRLTDFRHVFRCLVNGQIV